MIRTHETRTVRPPHGGAFEVELVPAERPSGHLPLVLVPGAGGPRGTFHHQVRDFSQDRDVVATNLNPYTGRGLRPVESGVRDVLFVLETFGVQRCDLIGASFGSCVVAQLAQAMPERVRRQLWVAPPIVRHLPWLGAFGPGWLYGGALMKFAPPRFHDRVAQYLEAGRYYAPEPDLDRKELRLLAGRVSDTSLAPFFRRLGGLLAWDWGRLPAPTERPLLVVQGRLEHAVSPDTVLGPLTRLAGQPPVVISGRHMPYLSFPEEFNRVAREHFDAGGA